MNEGEVTALSALAVIIGLAIASVEQTPVLVFIGCVTGTLTGLIPGLHFNTFLPFITGSNAFIIGVAIAHSFFDFFPAIMLGAPDEATALSVLPAHKMMLRGKALEAFRLTIIGGLMASITAMFFIPFLGFVQKMPFLVPLVLLFSIVLMLKQGLNALPIIVASAILGQLAFSLNALPSILSGFFGVSTILFSLWTKPVIPPQFPHAEVFIHKREIIFAAVAGWLAGLFPAVSSSVAAMAISPKMHHKKFLVVLGGTNTVYAFAAIMAIHLVGKARSGAALAISNSSLIFIIGTSLAAIGFSAWFAWMLSEKLVTSFNKVNYKLVSIAALVIVISLNALMGWESIILMLLSTMVGLLALFTGVKRNTCMASLIIPVLFYYVL